MSFGFADYDDLFLCRKSWVVFNSWTLRSAMLAWWLMVIPGPPERCSSSSLFSIWFNLGGLKTSAFPCMDPPSSLSWPSWGRWWLHKMDLVLPTLSLPWKRHTGIILHCYWLLRRQFGLTFWSSVQIFLFFFFQFFLSFDFLIMNCMISCVEFRDMVRYICTVRPPTRPLVREDSKKWSRWPCSKIVFATKKRRLF